MGLTRFETSAEGDAAAAQASADAAGVAAVAAQATANAALAAAAAATGILATGNAAMAALVTVADGDAATATVIVVNNYRGSRVSLFANGIRFNIGNGTKAGVPAYISGDGGATARAFSAIIAGDTIRWNGSIAGFQLADTDLLDLEGLTL